jgi:molybdopterin-guanine dinucleotide biosynthesis protein MobB
LKIIQLLGYSGSGKTRVITQLTEALSSRGSKVGVLKHLHDDAFTVDSRGKDTRKFARAGASVIVASSPNELAIIKRGSSKKNSINSLIEMVRRDGVEYLFVEGFYEELENYDLKKTILCARTTKEAASLLARHKGTPICILVKSIKNLGSLGNPKIPLVRLPADIDLILKMIPLESV